MTAPRLVVLASGRGTNFQALIDAVGAGELRAEIVALITNRPDAGAIERAERASIPVEVFEHRGRTPEDRARSDRGLIDVMAGYRPDLVVLAGWMRILGDAVGAAFPIINLHPAAPGTFPGVDAIDRAFAAFERGEIMSSGVMVHWVPDAGVDIGPLIVEETVTFSPGDTLDSFEARMHNTEHRLLVEGVRLALRDGPPGSNAPKMGEN